MEEKEILENLPETFNGYSTKELLKTWEELNSKEGTKSSQDQIIAMGQLLKDYKLGVHKYC